MPEPFAPLIASKKLLGGAEETTSGSAGTVTLPLTSTDVTDIQCDIEDIFNGNERAVQGQYTGNGDSVAGNITATLSFTVRIRPGDKTLPLLTACGWTLSASTYKPTSDQSAHKTWTFKVWEDGTRKLLVGVALTCKIEAKNGGIVTAKFSGKGVFKGEIDEAMPAFSPLTTGGYVLKAVTCTLGGSVLPMMSTIAIDLGVDVEERQSAAATEGVLHYLTGYRKPMVDLDLEARKVADHDAFGLMQAGTTAAFSLAMTSGANTMTIAAPRVQRVKLTDAARDRKRTNPVSLQCNHSAGDDELTFTEA